MEDASKDHENRASLALILQAIGVAAKVSIRARLLTVEVIGNAVQSAGVEGLYALGGETNIQGEDQKKLDVLANDVFINALIGTKKVSRMHALCNRQGVCPY